MASHKKANVVVNPTPADADHQPEPQPAEGAVEKLAGRVKPDPQAEKALTAFGTAYRDMEVTATEKVAALCKSAREYILLRRAQLCKAGGYTADPGSDIMKKLHRDWRAVAIKEMCAELVERGIMSAGPAGAGHGEERKRRAAANASNLSQFLRFGGFLQLYPDAGKLPRSVVTALLPLVDVDYATESVRLWKRGDTECSPAKVSTLIADITKARQSGGIKLAEIVKRVEALSPPKRETETTKKDVTKTDTRRDAFLKRVAEVIAPKPYTHESVVKAIASNPDTLEKLAALVREATALAESLAQSKASKPAA